MTSEDFFEPIIKQFQNKLPFVVYRKPNESEVKALLQKDSTLHITKDFTQTGFVFAPFDDKEDAVLIPFSKSEYSTIDVAIHARIGIHSISENNFFEDKEHHIDLVQKAIQKTDSGLFEKVVVSRQEAVTMEDSNPLDTFKRLLKIYPTAFVYCWCHPKVGLWLGASPETLLRIEGNQFTTMALAGTQNYEGALDVEWGNKEKEEQQLVTDFVVNSLEKTVDSLNVSDVETIKAGNLLHLRTTLTGTLNLKQSNLKQLLCNLHPTPAVCGQPKEMAMQFILENENYNREFYTGFLGELNMKQKISRNSNRENIENIAYSVVKNVTNLYVNLRCMQFKNNEALIYVGGGITKDSVPEDEWQETVSKTLVMKKALQ